MSNNRVDFDQYIDNYNQLLHDKTKFFASNEEYFASYKVNLVRENMATPVKRILEFGCGIGRNIPYLQKAFPGAEVIGTDIAAVSLETAARDNPTAQFMVDDGTLEIGSFDLIFVAGVFHHIPKEQRPGAAMALYYRLNAGASVFVFEHNPYNPVTRRIVSTCPYDEDAVLLRPGELKGLLQGAGMDIAKHRYCLFVPPSFPGVGWFERQFARIPLGGQYWVKATRA